MGERTISLINRPRVITFHGATFSLATFMELDYCFHFYRKSAVADDRQDQICHRQLPVIHLAHLSLSLSLSLSLHSRRAIVTAFFALKTDKFPTSEVANVGTQYMIDPRHRSPCSAKNFTSN